MKKARHMLKEMEIGDHAREDGHNDLKEKIEVTLHRLQELKQRVSELKRRCEELRQVEWEHADTIHMEDVLRCDKCGHALDREQQVAIKDSGGVERSHYHKECFQSLFK